MFFSPTNRSQEHLGMTLAFGSLLLGGTYNALAKGLTPFLSPMSLLILSEALTAFFIVMTFGIVPLIRKLFVLDWKTLWIAVFVGFLNSAIAPLLWFSGLARTSASNASMLSSADIVCTLLLGSLLLRERISRMQGVGALVVLSGVAVINVSSFSEPVGMHVGDLLILAGVFFFALGQVLFKKHLSHIMPELALVIRNVVGIVVVLGLSIGLRHSFMEEVAAFPPQKIMLLLAFGFFARYLNLTFFYEALDRLPSATLSLLSQVASPLSGLLFAFLILGESIGTAHLLGGTVIVFGLFVEHMSAQAVHSLRTKWSLHQLPFHWHAEPPPPVVLLPKHV